MPNIHLEHDTLLTVAKLMCISARTAPKARGRDNLVTAIIDEKNEIETIAREMERIAETEPIRTRVMTRDAQNVRQCTVIAIFGYKLSTYGLDCGFCGFDKCQDAEQVGARCFYSACDLGIAVSSAVNTANLHHIDNRIMYSIGYTIIKLNWLGPEVKLVLGVPLSATGKNIFFDRVK